MSGRAICCAAALLALMPGTRSVVRADDGEAASIEQRIERRTRAYSLYLEAYAAAARGENSRTGELLRQVLEIDPSATTVRSTLARHCLAQGDLLCAESEARRATELGAPQADGHKVLAQLALTRYRQSGDPRRLEEGIEQLKRAVELEPRDDASWSLLIRVLGSEGRIDEARSEARTASSIPGADPARPWLSLARTLLGRGERERAIEVLESLQLPGNSAIPLLQMLAELKGSEDDFEGQAAALDRLRTLRPDDADVAHGLGSARLRLGDPYAALEPLQAALEVRPADPAIARDTARALVMLGRGVEALDYLDDLPAVYETPPVLLLAAQAFEQAGRPADAARAIERVVEGLDEESRESIAPSLLLRAARSRLDAGEPERVLILLAPLGDDPVVLRLRLAALDRAGRGEEARELLSESLALTPVAPGLVALDALRTAESEGDDLAVERLVSAQSGAPDPRELLLGVVRALLVWQRSDLAGRLLEEISMPGAAEDPALLRTRAIVLSAEGRVAEAEAIFRRLLALRPDDHEILNELGYLLVSESRSLGEAIGLVERALELNPDEPAYLDSLGWALFRAGDPEAALPLLRRAVREAGEQQVGVIRDHLGDVYMALGDAERARAEWRAALSFGSEDPERTRAKLQRLDDAGSAER